jgi:Flp pilus assembly protein TadG
MRIRSAGRQDGFVTAETALVLPTLVGLGFALALVVLAVADQLRCADAAWEGARALARGYSVSDAIGVARRFAPHGAGVVASSAHGAVEVRVSASPAFGNALLPAVRVEGHAQVPCEPGVSCGIGDIGSGG